MSDVYKGTTITSLRDCPNTHLLKHCESGNEVVFWSKIKLETLASWRRDMLSSLKAGVYYIELVNISIQGDVFRLNRESVRLETQLSKMLKIKGKLLTESGASNRDNCFWKSEQRLRFGEMASSQ